MRPRIRDPQSVNVPPSREGGGVVAHPEPHRPYHPPVLVTYGTLAELTALANDDPFDGGFGTRQTT